MEFENQNAFEEIVSKEGLNLFLGAGFSVHSYNRDDTKLLLGSELKDYLLRHFDLNQFTSSSLAKVATHLKRNRKGDFYYLLKNFYTVNRFDDTYLSLQNLPVVNIFTTNIDNLCEKIWENSCGNYISDVEVYGYIESPGINLYKLHGSVTYTHEKEMLFSSAELSGAFLRDPALWHTVSMKLASKPTLFWGTNLEDPNIIDTLNSETNGNRPSFPKWIVILPDVKMDWIADEFSNNGYRVIRSTTNELLTYFANKKFIKNQNQISLKEELSRFFPKEYLQSIENSNHPSRPIASFYQGADPTWSDVLQGKLAKISFYSGILERILKKNNCHITGSPGSGKTTLLMQLAISKEISGTKFFFSDIDPERAIFFAKKINKEELVFVFLDNVADNIESYNIIKSLPQVTIITAERDVKYESVKHLLKINKNQIVDVSDLQTYDIQNICDSMQRRTQYFPNERVSLFELCYKLWSGQDFISRINSLLEQIQRHSSDLLEFYSLMTYVRYTGISASMDMMLCYYADDKIIDYKKIYEFKSMIDSLVDDTTPLDDNYQDYFTLRSQAFSELSIKYLPANFLAKVLTKFHKNVYRGLIKRFDIFRKKAVDADITTKAFPDINEGKKFYTMVLKNIESPFVIHQFSLYLWRKGNIKEAWFQIDDAYTRSSGKIYSINNTHALILFASNIHKKPDDKGIVLETLKSTFAVLENCLQYDQRKSYHLTTYVHHSLEYFKKFKDEYGEKCLNNAYNYLNNELAKDQYIPHKTYRDFVYLKNEIEKVKNFNK